MTLCQLVKAIDDFNSKFGISGVGDVFLLYGGVNDNIQIVPINMATDIGAIIFKFNLFMLVAL
jgi:hypothetical protein